VGYAALYNLGCILAVLGFGGRAAVITVLVSLTVRALALVLIAASVSTIHLRVVSDGFAQVRGIALQMPVAAAGLVIGGLTLAGVPFTAGFAPHWQLLHTAAQVDARWAALLILGGLGVAIGYLRGFRATLSSVQAGKNKESRSKSGLTFQFQEPLPLLVIIGLLSLACILLGFFPSFLIEPLQALSMTISLPIR
jgi:multicomponent Na+:H+ antiporter subunit D